MPNADHLSKWANLCVWEAPIYPMRQKKQYVQQDLFNPIIPKKKEEKFWTLTFNGQVLVNRMPYPVCMAKKQTLIKQSPGFGHLYKIRPAK